MVNNLGHVVHDQKVVGSSIVSSNMLCLLKTQNHLYLIDLETKTKQSSNKKRQFAK